jgi:hypothetical protein
MFSLRLSLFCGDFVAPFPSNLGVRVFYGFESPCVEFTLASGVDISFGATNLPSFPQLHLCMKLAHSFSCQRDYLT